MFDALVTHINNFSLLVHPQAIPATNIKGPRLCLIRTFSIMQFNLFQKIFFIFYWRDNNE